MTPDVTESFRSSACVSPSDSVKDVPRGRRTSEQIRIAFLARLQISDGYRHVLPGGKPWMVKRPC